MLKRKFYNTSNEFRSSERCSSELQKCIERMTKQSHRVYSILNDLKILLKHEAKNGNNKTNREVLLGIPREALGQVDSSTPGNVGSIGENHIRTRDAIGEHSASSTAKDTRCPDNVDEDSDVIMTASPELQQPPEHSTSPGPSTSSTKPTIDISSSATLRGKHIVDRKGALVTRLEGSLARISKAIRNLEEKDLDLDAMDSPDSPYIQLDLLKRRYLYVWRRLCEARRVARISQRILKRRFTYTGCRYSSVNAMIADLVNNKKRFPDMTDVRSIVSHVNKNEKLQLSSAAVTELARHVFIDVGHLLKRRRQSDLLHDFGCYLTDDLRMEDDPTYKDPTLRRRLAENRHLGEVKLNSVFEKFVQLQQSVPNEINEIKRVDAPNVKTVEPCHSSAASAKAPKHDSECSLSNSDSAEIANYEVVSLSSDSDEAVDENNGKLNTAAEETKQLVCQPVSEPCIVVPDDPPVSDEYQANAQSPRTPSRVVPTEPVVHLSDDEDNTCAITDHRAIEPANTVSVASKPCKSLLISSVLPDQFSLPHSCMPLIPPMGGPSVKMRAATIYPMIHETRSLTMTQQCSLGPGGVQTAVYRQAATTSRVFCPPFVNRHSNLVSSTVCISSIHSLSSGPRHRRFTQTTESHQHVSSNTPSSNVKFDCSGPIVLD